MSSFKKDRSTLWVTKNLQPDRLRLSLGLQLNPFNIIFQGYAQNLYPTALTRRLASLLRILLAFLALLGLLNAVGAKKIKFQSNL